LKWSYIYIALICLTGCNKVDKHSPDDAVIASAGSKNLYLSEIKNLIPDGSEPDDSISIANQFIDNWLRKSILLEEAEKYLGDQLDIDQLVKDYRESLLIYNYERKLVEEELDTIITNAQKEEFYNLTKETYHLTDPIVKVNFIMVPDKNEGLRAFKKDWIRQDLEAMKAYSEKYDLTYTLDESNWITFAQLNKWLPEGLFSEDQLKSGKSLDKVKDGYQYFVKVTEFLDENEVAPLSYIEDKVEKVMLYNRKVALLKNIKEQLYQKEIKLNRVKINN
jgi:hypothetical protein